MRLARLTLLAAVTVGVAPAPSRAGQPATEGAPTRVAVWGLRHDHVWWVLPQLQALTETRIVAVGGERPDLLERAGARLPPGTPLYLELERMLDREKPDALVALAPNDEHLAILRACARRGIHFYTHKPLATSVADARAMDRVARQARLVTVVYTYPVLDPANQAFFARVIAGELGPLRKLVVMGGHPGPAGLGVLSDDYRGWLYDRRKHGGGALTDMGTYGLLYAAWLLGPPTSVLASIARHAPGENQGADDESWMLLEYPGATAAVQGSWSMPFRHIGELVAAGPRGQLRVWDGKVWFRAAGAKDGVPEAGQPLPASAPTGAENGVAHFVDCIRRGTPVHPAFTTTVNVLVHELVEAAERSSRTGRRVKLPRAR